MRGQMEQQTAPTLCELPACTAAMLLHYSDSRTDGISS
jgi:hypothetical protein